MSVALTSACAIPNCRKKAPDHEAFCANHRDTAKMIIDRDDWLTLHRQIGAARGIMQGFLILHHSQHEKAREVAAKWLAETNRTGIE